MALAGNQPVSSLCPGDGKAVRDERRQVQLALIQQVDERFHVAGFGPANVTDGIVASLLLEGRVVAPGAIRARNAEIEFFAVINLALDLYTYGSDGDDHSAIARNLAGQIHRSAAGSLGRDQNRIDADASGEFKTQIAEFSGGRCGLVSAQA